MSDTETLVLFAPAERAELNEHFRKYDEAAVAHRDWYDEPWETLNHERRQLASKYLRRLLKIEAWAEQARRFINTHRNVSCVDLCPCGGTYLGAHRESCLEMRALLAALRVPEEPSR